MILPILISVSVTPVSYFFWANALLPLAASKMMAVENAANRRATKDISFLPIESMNCVYCRLRSLTGLRSDSEHPLLGFVDPKRIVYLTRCMRHEPCLFRVGRRRRFKVELY